MSDPAFLLYVLSGESFLSYAQPRMTGSSGRQRLSLEDLAAMPVVLPPIEEQRRIVAVLQRLDRLVDNNRRLAELPLALLDALWRQRVLGRPGECKLNELLDLNKGVSYKGQFLGSGRALINLANFGTDGTFIRTGTKLYSGAVKQRHVVSPGEIVLANTDLTQRRDILGRPVLVPGDLENSVISHHTFAVRSAMEDRPGVYAVLRSPGFRAQATGYATGTTVAALPADAVLNYMTPWPSLPDRRSFVEQARPLLAAVDNAALTVQVVLRARSELAEELLRGGLRTVGS